jgi:GNAT superfamily N-acetyltransferase
MDVRLRRLTRDQAAACAKLHKAAFPEFFLSQLGEQFLREFYNGFVDDPDAITAVCLDPSGRLLGVVVGTFSPSGFFSRLLKRRWHAFACASVALALRHPRHLPRLLRAVTYRGQIPLATSGALLSSICVAPDARGMGVGRTLLRAFEAEVDGERVAAYLVTDRADNESTNAFYSRNGWRLAGNYDTPEGRPMNCYVHDVAEAGT